MRLWCSASLHLLGSSFIHVSSSKHGRYSHSCAGAVWFAHLAGPLCATMTCSHCAMQAMESDAAASGILDVRLAMLTQPSQLQRLSQNHCLRPLALLNHHTAHGVLVACSCLQTSSSQHNLIVAATSMPV